MTETQNGRTIISCLRYRDAHAAIKWLCDACGFAKHAVYDDEKGGVAQAQLMYGKGMVMIGSVREDAYGQRVVQPTHRWARNASTLRHCG